jgi:hypothetical protein
MDVLGESIRVFASSPFFCLFALFFFSENGRFHLSFFSFSFFLPRGLFHSTPHKTKKLEQSSESGNLREMATRSIDLECRETLCRETLRRETRRRETIFGICETDPDEVLEVLFECWKRSADDEATVTETMDRAIEACSIRRAELPDSFSDSDSVSDSVSDCDAELPDAVSDSVSDCDAELPDAAHFSDFYGAPG